ncbi:MAG: hypothetical protein GY851_23165 [bacterium]|nr:hypothetical protein [bacterium]
MFLRSVTSAVATVCRFDLTPTQCWYDGAAAHTLADRDCLARKELMLNAACVDVRRGHNMKEWQRTGDRMRKYIVQKGFVCTGDRVSWAVVLMNAVRALDTGDGVLLENLCANWNGEVRGLANVPMFLVACDGQGVTTHVVARFGVQQQPLDNTVRLDQCTEAEQQHAASLQQASPARKPPAAGAVTTTGSLK